MLVPMEKYLGHEEKGIWFRGRKAWKIELDREELTKLQRVNLGVLLSQGSEGQKETFPLSI